jgi:ABC-2 type transport system permease protein
MPIFDQGYQHWKGPLSGHAWRWLAIARHGVRSSLKNRWLRWLVFLAWIPALVLITVLAIWGLLEQQVESVLAIVGRMLPPEMLAEPRAYRSAVWTIAYSFFFKAELFLTMLLVVVVGPNLVSRDLRFNALPLYFSRPLTRFDYFLGKLGVIGFYLAAVAVVPATAAYVLGVGFSLDLSVIADTHRLLGASVVYGLIITVSAGTLMLALSSLSRRSLYVSLIWVGLWIISSSVASMLYHIQRETIIRDERRQEIASWNQKNPPPSRGPNQSQEDWNRYHEAQRRMYAQVRAKSEAVWGEAARGDWRPICAYTNNLDRLADELLGTDAAWVAIGKVIERPRRAVSPLLNNPRDRDRAPALAEQPLNERRLADLIVPQYPWYWSAGVLAGLLGLSVWILSFRVKSLDRLR